jgi:two-component system cell cycle sensor histidine kinase/response regulator CckA
MDLVFSDVVLPDVDALVMVSHLQSTNPDVRILLTSGYTDQRARQATIEKLGLRFIAKPFSSMDLLTAVASILADDEAPL